LLPLRTPEGEAAAAVAGELPPPLLATAAAADDVGGPSLKAVEEVTGWCRLQYKIH